MKLVVTGSLALIYVYISCVRASRLWSVLWGLRNECLIVDSL